MYAKQQGVYVFPTVRGENGECEINNGRFEWMRKIQKIIE